MAKQRSGLGGIHNTQRRKGKVGRGRGNELGLTTEQEDNIDKVVVVVLLVGMLAYLAYTFIQYKTYLKYRKQAMKQQQQQEEEDQEEEEEEGGNHHHNGEITNGHYEVNDKED